MDYHLAVITVNYNNYSVTQEFLESLSIQSVQNSYRVFVSDLSDKRQDLKLSEKTGEVLISQNKGYAHGINLGLKKAIQQGFDKFVVINNDTVVLSGFTTSCLASLKSHPNSIIGGKIYYAKGYEYHKDSYKADELGNVLWYAGGTLDWDNVITKHRGVDEVDHSQYDLVEETEFVTGCLMCFDKSVYARVGDWDVRYFLYYEDADWCERAKRQGTKLYYDPSIVIWHKNAQSTGGAGSALHQKFGEKNCLKFGLKYAPLRTKLHLLKNYFIGF